jgi:hypothetical protein
LLERAEIKLKAYEEAFRPEDLKIEEFLFNEPPYIIVTCEDTEKGDKLYDRVQEEVPRFERL